MGADYSLRILFPLARWLEEKRGAAAFLRVAKAARLEPADFRESTKWITHAQLESFAAAARSETVDEQEFKNACAYRFRDTIGALRHMVWALSPGLLFEGSVRASRMMVNVGRFEKLASTRTSFTVSYTSTKPETRLLCLTRQRQWELCPTLWDLPPARLEERSCIGHGDARCEYHLTWLARWRTFPVFVGLALGLLAGVTVAQLHSTWLPTIALGLLGMGTAHMLELRRMHRLNVDHGANANEALHKLGMEDAEARAENIALQERQREWTRTMENQVAERTTALEKVLDGLDVIQKSRVSTLHGFSHDLRNPLSVLKGNTLFLKDTVKTKDEAEALVDMELAADRMETMLLQLMEVASQETTSPKLSAQPVVIAPLAEIFGRRLRALVFGTNLKVVVASTGEAPDMIDVDRVVFDRIVDNLLTNAAKYTTRGSIVLEIGGVAADHLTLRLTDTGQGIAAEQLARMFQPRPANEPSTRESRGVGLSSAVRLLAQIGGRLEVMSKPGTGTTFWVHLPRTAVENKRIMASDETFESVIARVVTIRGV